MFDQVFKIIDHILGPEKTWASFAQKSISLVLLGGLTLFGVYTYGEFKGIEDTGEDSVEVVLEEDQDKRKEIEELLQKYSVSSSNVTSVWLYGWPDARSIKPVMNVGLGQDPLPLGYLQDRDQEAVGAFVFGNCVHMKRDFFNKACPINGDEDSWGFIVVQFQEGAVVTEKCANAVAALADRISYIIYQQEQ